MKKILLFLLFFSILECLSFVSAEETIFTDNVRMTNGWATIYHTPTDNHPIGFISAQWPAAFQINAHQGNLVLRTVGYGITNIYLNDNFANASTYIGSANEWYTVAVKANGKVGIGLLEPQSKFHVNGTARIDGQSQFNGKVTINDVLILEKRNLSVCNAKNDGAIARNKSGFYGCLEEVGWKKFNLV